MEFSDHDLLPYYAFSSTLLKMVSSRVPFTPFFLPVGTTGISRTIAFKGSDFYLQNKNTRYGDETGSIVSDDPICGVAAYRVFTSEDHAASPIWNGSITLDYFFDTGGNTVTVTSTVVGSPSIGLSNSRTATHSYYGDRFSDPVDYAEADLSGPVDQTWLAGSLDDWRSQSESFRAITGAGLSTYSYIGQAATLSEGDGYLAIVGGGEFVAAVPTFADGTIGMSGDAAALWDGNFSANLMIRARKNAPVIHQESSSSRLGLTANVFTGMEIYRDGYAEVQVSEPNELWLDAYGIFATEEADGSGPCEGISISDLSLLPGLTGDGKFHEILLVSRTGRKYRVTLQSGHDDSGWITEQTYSLITDTATLRATVTLDAYVDATTVRISKIEIENLVSGTPYWAVRYDVASGLSPYSLIDSEITATAELLITARQRDGQRFGYRSLDLSADPDSFYLTKTSRLHLTPGDYEEDSGGCGGGVTGSADIEWVDAYDPATGLPLPRDVSEFALIINGIDWTPEELPNAGVIGSFPDSSPTVETTTVKRWEGTFTTAGSWLVKFDAPDPQGQISAEEPVLLGMTLVDTDNLSDPSPLDPPSAGYSRFPEGHRLSY